LPNAAGGAGREERPPRPRTATAASTAKHKRKDATGSASRRRCPATPWGAERQPHGTAQGNQSVAMTLAHSV
jgi:hypothetical protein